jgi:hypothetical protein
VLFHVEISGGLNRARAFNLSLGELQRQVLEPWLTGRSVELGEREWAPATSSLRILEGRHLDGPDLSFGQGWANAERTATDVTRRLLTETKPPKLPDAFLVETDLPEAMVAELLGGRQGHPVPLSEVEGKLDGRDADVAAVILVRRRRSAP